MLECRKSFGEGAACIQSLTFRASLFHFVNGFVFMTSVGKSNGSRVNEEKRSG